MNLLTSIQPRTDETKYIVLWGQILVPKKGIATEQTDKQSGDRRGDDEEYRCREYSTLST